jgi:hypothetical protein
MKRAVLTLAAVAALGGVTAIPAQARTCKSVKCLQKQVTLLTKVVVIDTKYLVAFNKCMTEVPVTEYGNVNGNGTDGYAFLNPDGTQQDTTALDGTSSGDQVSSWLMTDGCNPNSTANFRTARTTATAAFVNPIEQLLGQSQSSGPLKVTKMFSYRPQPASSVFGPLTSQFASLTPHSRSH